MNNLCNELTSNTIVYSADGKIDNIPPNSLQLRAARAIKTCYEQLDGLSLANTSFQKEIAQLEHEVFQLRAHIATLTKTEEPKG